MVLGGADCMMHAQGSKAVAICLPIFTFKALVSTFCGLIDSGNETLCKLHPRHQSKQALFWSRFLRLVKRAAKLSSKYPFNHQPRCQPCSIRPLFLECMLCMRGINRESPQNSGSFVRQDDRCLPQSFVARMHDRLGRMRVHPRIGS